MASLHAPPLSRPRQVIERYVGLPYRLGAGGPDAYDCWGLTCELVRPRLPDYWDHTSSFMQVAREFTKNAGDARHWEEAQFEDYTLVVMGYGRFCHHAGVWLAGGILHADKPCVTWNTMNRLKMQGWRTFRPMRWIREAK